jgi:hypothetical protein
MALPIQPGQNASLYQQDITAQYGVAAGNAYRQLVLSNKNSNVSAYQLAEVYLTEIVGKGLASAISDVANGTLAATASASGSGFGLPGALGGTSSGSGNDWQHLMIRLAEFAIGGILVAIGVNAMLRKSETYQSATKTAKSAGAIAAKGII